MKRYLLPLLLCIISTLVFSINEVSAQTNNQYFRQEYNMAKARYQEFEDNFRQFVQHMDTSLKLRQNAKLLFKGLNSKLQNNTPIRANELVAEVRLV